MVAVVGGSGVVVWWCGVVVWWCGGVVVWWCGGVVVWCGVAWWWWWIEDFGVYGDVPGVDSPAVSYEHLAVPETEHGAVVH